MRLSETGHVKQICNTPERRVSQRSTIALALALTILRQFVAVNGIDKRIADARDLLDDIDATYRFDESWDVRGAVAYTHARYTDFPNAPNYRYVSGFLLAFILSNPFARPGLLRTRRPGLQIVRSMLMLGSTGFNFYAVKYLQLDQTTSIGFATPFLVAVLSGPMLGEWVGWRRWVAISVGFCGVLLVARPGFGGIHPAALLSVAAVLCYGFYFITTRIVSRFDSSETTLFYSNIVGVVAMSCLAPFVWTMPQSWHLFALMVAIGAFGTIGHYLLIIAHRMAPPSVLVMGLFVVGFFEVCREWSPHPDGGLLNVAQFMAEPLAVPLLLCLLGIAVAGGMFVVPLYAFLTTFVDKSQTSRTIAANNIVNSFAMVIGSLIATGLSWAGVPIVQQVLLSALMCVVAAGIAQKLVAAERAAR